MKKPDAHSASEDYGELISGPSPYLVTLLMRSGHAAGKLGNAMKNDEIHEYAALCFTAMAK